MSLSPALTPDEVDAPHVASIVEQFHGAWRDRADAPNSARTFTEVRLPQISPATRARTFQAFAFRVFVFGDALRETNRARLRDASIVRRERLTRTSLSTRRSESKAELPRLRAQVFAPRATVDDDDNEEAADVPERASAELEEGAPDEDDETVDDERRRAATTDSRDERSSSRARASVADLPLMRVFDPSFAPTERAAPEAPEVSSAAYSPRGTSRGTAPNGGDSRDGLERDTRVKFALTLSSAAFEAGPLEAMRGTVCLVDLGPTEKADAAPHGYRRRLTENVAFFWREGEVGGSSGGAPTTAIFELPAASVTLTTRAFVQLTHLAPAAGGLDPKVYTHKTQREAEKFLAKDRKRLEKLDVSTAFADPRHPPSAIVAWAVLPVTELVEEPGGGVVRLVSGATKAASMFRVKETYTEAQALDAAAASSHAMKNHKPIRCALAFEVTPLVTRERAEEASRVARRAPTPRLLASDPARGNAPAPAWWEAGEGAGETSRRDLFVYVDTTSIGRRKDTRVRVQLREDDLDIDARGSRAVVVAEAGDASDARSSSSSDDEAEEEEAEEEEEQATKPNAGDDGAADGVGAAAPGIRKRRPRERPRRASWSHVSTGKAKGGAWCHEVRVRLPARLNPGHHLVFSVFGRDPEPASSGWGSLGGKVGPEEPLGHAVLSLAAARETLAPDIALAALPMRGSKRLGGTGVAAVPPGGPRTGAAAGESSDPASSAGTWVGVNGGIENGRDVALPAVRDLLPKYMQENVRAHMKYVDDKGKPCVFARLRLRSNVHTSDARVGALYASSAAAAAADEAHAEDELSARGAKTHAPSRSRGGSSLGGASAASRAVVKTATRELCAALRDVHRASAEQLLAHLPAIMHLLLTLIAAPPPAVAAQVAADAALAASAAEARATAARAEAAARLAEANAAATAAKAADGAFAAETRPASSPEPPPPPPRTSPTPDSPASDFSVDASASSPELFGVVSASESASPSPSPSPAAAALPSRARTPGLVEQAFAALVRVAARTQTLEPSVPAAGDFERSPPLEAYAARVFDDARCAADWRGAARAALLRESSREGASKREKKKKDAATAGTTPLFPRLASLYASRLRETADAFARGRGGTDPEAAREAADARRACWFVFALIGRSASLDAARRSSHADVKERAMSAQMSADETPSGSASEGSRAFAAAPSGPATPAAGDARVEALAEMARVVSAETLVSAPSPSPSPSEGSPTAASLVATFDDGLRRGMNLSLARLCASLVSVVGPPPASRSRDKRDADVSGSDDDASDDDASDYDASDDDAAFRDADGGSRRFGRSGVETRRWWRGGDGAGRDETAPLAPLARRVASSHVRRLTADPKAFAFLYEFCVAACAAPRFVAAAAGAVRGAGWSPEDLAFEKMREDAAALLDAAAAERGGAGEFRDDLDEGLDAETPRPSDALVSATALAAFAGLRAAEDDRRDAAAGAVAAILTRHALDASLQSRSARAAVAATYAPQLRLLVARRDEILDAAVPAETRRSVLASFLSLARDANQRALWTWLASDVASDTASLSLPGGDGFSEAPGSFASRAFASANEHVFGRARARSVRERDPARRAAPPPRLASFLCLLRDALEAFAFATETDGGGSEGGASPEGCASVSVAPANASSIVAEGHRSAAVTLAVLELLRRGGAAIAAAQKREDAFWARRKSGSGGARRGGAGAVGAMFGSSRGSVSRSEREARARADARAARAALEFSPAKTFFEGSLGVLLTAMRAEQSEEAWRALARFLRGLLWDRRADLLRAATYDPTATATANGATLFSASEPTHEVDPANAFPPPPAPPPGTTPHAFLESASALLLRAGASSSRTTRAEATSCVRALLEACVDVTGSAVALRPTLTYALCAALYAPLGAAARRGALAGELASLREPKLRRDARAATDANKKARGEKKAREDWEKATRDVLIALSAAEARLRALAKTATGPRASPDVHAAVEAEIAAARAFAWAPAAHCKALRSLSARLASGGHWVEAAEAAATAAWTAMRALALASEGRGCVWNAHDASALAAACASAGESETAVSTAESRSADAAAFPRSDASRFSISGARCGVEEISEEKILAHLAEATRLFVKGGHLEAAARAAKAALPAWERRRAFARLARAHEDVAFVYRALHAQPPAGAAGSGAFGACLPPPPGPPPPPATHYRVRLVGRAWDALGFSGKTWIHREPRDRTLGEMLRALQKSLAPRRENQAADDDDETFPPVEPMPASGEAGDGACVHVTAVEPVFEASASWLEKHRRHAPRSENDAPDDAPDADRGDVGSDVSGSGSRTDPLVLDDEDDASDDRADGFVPHGGWFPTARAFVHDAPFTRDDAASATAASATVATVATASPAARALRAQWRRRVTSRVAGRFPGLRARLEVTGETVTEMPPAASCAEMLGAQRRAIAASAETWESLSRNAGTSDSAIGGGALGGGDAEFSVSTKTSATDDGAAARAAETALGALQRSLQGSLAAGVNGGVPTVCEAFFPADAEEAPAMAEAHRIALIDALGKFVGACARAVETHGRAAREAAAEANAAAREAKAASKRGIPREAKAAAESAAAAAAATAASMERMQGMFVRCAAEVRRDVALAVARAEERHGAGDGDDGSEKSA